MPPHSSVPQMHISSNGRIRSVSVILALQATPNAQVTVGSPAHAVAIMQHPTPSVMINSSSNHTSRTSLYIPPSHPLWLHKYTRRTRQHAMWSTHSCTPTDPDRGQSTSTCSFCTSPYTSPMAVFVHHPAPGQ